MKTSFILRTDYWNAIRLLSHEERGKLLEAIFLHELGEDVVLDDFVTDIAFSFIAADLDRNRARYEERCKRNAENGKKGGRPKKNKSAREEVLAEIPKETIAQETQECEATTRMQNFYAEHHGKEYLTRAAKRAIACWTEKIGEEAVAYAIELTALNAGTKPFGYIVPKLAEWQAANLHTRAEIDAYTANRKAKNKEHNKPTNPALLYAQRKPDDDDYADVFTRY